MSRWSDLAKWAGPTENQSGPMNRHDGVVLHIAAGTFTGTIAWQRNPKAEVSSHFIVARDGRIAQMVDTDVTAWTQRDGNGEWISVENEGYLPDPLTDAQIEANAQILARAHLEYGVPLQVTDTPAQRGLGHHSMGAENGINWGHSACPGEAIKAQKQAIVDRAVAIVNGEDDDMPKLPILVKERGKPAVWVGDFITRRWVRSREELSGLRSQMKQLGLSTEIAEWAPGSIGVLGVLVGPDPDGPAS